MERIKVLGVHLVPADEPVHLIEIELADNVSLDFGQVTQKVVGQPEEDWQVAYDEQELEHTGSKRFAFFFLYLVLSQPLETQFGSVKLPPESPLPDHLMHIDYESP